MQNSKKLLVSFSGKKQISGTLYYDAEPPLQRDKQEQGANYKDNVKQYQEKPANFQEDNLNKNSLKNSIKDNNCTSTTKAADKPQRGNCLGLRYMGRKIFSKIKPSKQKKSQRRKIDKGSSATKCGDAQQKNGQRLVPKSSFDQGQRVKTQIDHQESYKSDSQENFYTAKPTLSSQVLSPQEDQLQKAQSSKSEDINNEQPGCLPNYKFNILKVPSINIGRRRNSTHVQSPKRQQSTQKQAKLPYGSTLKKISQVSADNNDPDFGPIHRECWSQVDPQNIKVRGQHYQANKQKIPSLDPIYNLVGVDMITLDKKMYNIAEIIELPKPLQYTEQYEGVTVDKLIPPILVINIMLPLYAPSVVSTSSDGKGQSLVYYFQLSQSFNPSTSEDYAKQLKLIMDITKQDLPNDSSKQFNTYRHRMKLVPKIENVEEFCKRIKLSRYQMLLLDQYKDKPMMTKPHHKYFVDKERNYWEFDMDAHMYSYFLRQAFYQFYNQSVGIVFDNSFVIQGESMDELPEIMLGGATVYRLDFAKERYLDDALLKVKSNK